MSEELHWRALERIYLQAPTNKYYQPAIRVGSGESEIRIAIRPDFHHAAHAVHGSVYFKMLDDCGFFAANSLVRDVFVLTSSYTIHLLRPVAAGTLLARGKVLSASSRQFVAESHLYDDRETLIAHGVGTFVRSRLDLSVSEGYSG
ncbi:MAG TPA: PaaI family thioesterase [Thermoanaerobaculia bacterium]|nr:PaaI family thioesterase [Thermoanaerobaculia bacterium]